MSTVRPCCSSQTTCRIGSLERDAGLIDQGAPLRCFALAVGAKLSRAGRGGFDAELGEPLLHGRQVERFLASGIEFGDDLRGVPAGTARPFHAQASKSGTPASAIVGTSGTAGM